MTTLSTSPASLKEQVSLRTLLEKLGFQPACRSGAELVYHSMLRNNDQKPSFSVNDDLGVWYDDGTGKGGNLADFGLAYWPDLTFSEVLSKIWEIAQQATPFSFQPARNLLSRISASIPNGTATDARRLEL